MQSSPQYWTTPCKQRDAAIALNNIGATLLQRQCYSDALNSFDSAFRIIKSLLANEFPNFITTRFPHLHHFEKNVQNGFNMNLVNESLLDASQKLSKSTTNMCKTREDSGTTGCTLRIITVDKSVESIHEIMNENPTASSLFILRIDDVDEYYYDNDQLDFYETLIELSTILGNIGTLFRCFALTRQQEKVVNPSKKKFQKNFIKLVANGLQWCEVSFKVLSFLCTMTEENDESNTNLNIRIRFMKVYVLQNLMFLTAERRDIEKSRTYYTLLGDIQCQLNNDFDDDHSSSNDTRISSSYKMFRINAARAA